jgi:hypothetical protein
VHHDTHAKSSQLFRHSGRAKREPESIATVGGNLGGSPLARGRQCSLITPPRRARLSPAR